LARKEDLVGRSLAGSSVSGTDAGIDLPRPRVGLMSSEDNWLRPRGDWPSRLLGRDSRRRPWRRWPGLGDDVVLQSGDPWTVSPSEARSDLAEGVVDAEGAATPSIVRIRACRVGFVARVFCGRRGQNTPSPCRKAASLFLLFRVLFSSCFEYPDFFVGNKIVCASWSCFSRKVTSEVSVSRRRRSPSARSALPLTRTLTRPWGSVTDAVEMARRIAPAEGLSNVKTCSVCGITHTNVSYLSQKVMSEVSVSRRRRSPSARSALAAYVYSVVLRIHFRSSQKARKTFWQKRSFFEENFDAEGVPPF
jgi:hypothetical protein